ncbi:MAG TPA: hypothetical protein VFP36_13840, partial [Usitatibacter sp.]|nr:hypothetical protein [Usitatibacter sp.]
MSASPAISRFIASVAALAATLLFVPLSLAQPWSAAACAGDRSSAGLQCTANDISVAQLTTDATQCIAGDTVTLNFTASLSSNAGDRHDIGIFISQDGKSPIVPSAGGGSASCAVYDLPTTPLPLIDIDGDTCGDIRANDKVTFPIPKTLTATVKCTPGTDGKLTVPTAISWSQNTGLVCSGPDYVGPGTGSKCEYGSVSVPTVSVLGKIHITKQTTPDAAAGTFSFSATGTGADPTSFTLGDNGSQTITTAALSSAGSDYTVSEGALAGFLPTAQIACQDAKGQPQTAFVTADGANRSVTLHMAADPANGLSEVYCTFTNTKIIAGSITIEKTTAGGDGTFSFANTGGVQGSLTNPATFDITTSTTTHRGTQELSSLAAGTYTITETVPAGWDLTS